MPEGSAKSPPANFKVGDLIAYPRVAAGVSSDYRFATVITVGTEALIVEPLHYRLVEPENCVREYVFRRWEPRRLRGKSADGALNRLAMLYPELTATANLSTVLEIAAACEVAGA